MYLRVGASGSGHSRFIHDLADGCDLTRLDNGGSAKKWFANGYGRKRCSFESRKRMVAFDGIAQKEMCTASNLVYLAQDSTKKKVDTYIFSMDMRVLGDFDADDVLKYAFGARGHRKHSDVLYERITEIHHMLPDGTVRILASEGAKLVDPIILTRVECLQRQIIREAGGSQ